MEIAGTIFQEACLSDCTYADLTVERSIVGEKRGRIRSIAAKFSSWSLCMRQEHVPVLFLFFFFLACLFARSLVRSFSVKFSFPSSLFSRPTRTTWLDVNISNDRYPPPSLPLSLFISTRNALMCSFLRCEPTRRGLLRRDRICVIWDNALWQTDWSPLPNTIASRSVRKHSLLVQA